MHKVSAIVELILGQDPLPPEETAEDMLFQQYESLTFQDRGFTDWWYDGGVGTGKTHLATRWLYRQIQEQHPDVVGFIGANDYNQLNQAVLPPFVQYMAKQGISYVINKKPPLAWRPDNDLRWPDNKGILTLSTGHQYICKYMKENFNLPGIQIGYWWVDEIGYVNPVAMQLLRERRRQPGANRLGLVTGTPGGFAHFTYSDYMNPSTKLPRHGWTIAKTMEAVEAGFVPLDYYEMLAAQYSKRKALARLEGQVVDSEMLRAYESHGTAHNCTTANPFNGFKPGASVDHPIGVFCDFNPVKTCIWEIGQFNHKHTHVFDEIALETNRVEVMMFELKRRYGRWPSGFHVFGDASGGRAEMSEGKTPYLKMQQMFKAENWDVRAQFSYPKANPHIVDRIEAMNASLQAFDGTVSLTYDERKCPHLHLDFLRVGYDGVKLLDQGDDDRTHASDGVGYHISRVRPVRGPSFVPVSGHGQVRR